MTKIVLKNWTKRKSKERWRLGRHHLQPFCLMLIFLLSACTYLPPRPDLPFERALRPAATGHLADFSNDFRKLNRDEQSGFKLLFNAKEAFEARLALIDMATSSIDLQYFIWKGDATGTLLFERLLQAADRGVRVRIIIDDIWLGISTADLTALNSHPNLELRVFNPNPSRDYTIGGAFHFLAAFKALNRRMHNKLMVIDNLVLIAGGRNIGDEYFGLGRTLNFIDLDVLAVGAVLAESSHAFDDYWNNSATYPVSGWNIELAEETFEEMRRRVSDAVQRFTPQLSPFQVEQRDWAGWLQTVAGELKAGEAHFLQDDPVNIDGKSYRLLDMIAYLADPTEKEFILSTPYLIPKGSFIQDIEEGTTKNIEVNILTNSLGSTNHTMVHSHYKKYRRRLLESGARLFEFHRRPGAELRDNAEVETASAKYISLHAKALVSDRKKAFIGSLNFDPRALVINTENGLLIESKELAGELTDILKEIMSPENSWKLTINEQNNIEFQMGNKIRANQPARGFFQRLQEFFFRLLPIESQL